MRTVVAIAQSQEQDQSALPAIQAWASLGNFGKSSKNEERDMHTWLRNLIQHPAGSLLDHSQTPGYLDSLKHRMVYSTYSSTSFDNILTVYFPC